MSAVASRPLTPPQERALTLAQRHGYVFSTTVGAEGPRGFRNHTRHSTARALEARGLLMGCPVPARTLDGARKWVPVGASSPVPVPA